MTFYLGRYTDDNAPVQYDPADLTTHAVVIGMTGSGKTGLVIAMLEEAAKQGLPALIIDPKGDLTNLLLHFPGLLPADFAPWIDPEQARRQNTTVDALAASTAERWSKGLAEWGLGAGDLKALRDSVEYTIYTPGSTAGVPVNLLSSFDAPSDWHSAREAARERIASTVTAVLGLVGMNNIDPLRSREHILLSNIFETAWSQGQSLDLSALIEQVQQPPFDRLGAFSLDRFFPQKDRFELALLLNNFLAAPSFQAWLEGQPLEAGPLLWTPAGKPRFSIFYLAHLGENERMFFVTLLLAAVEGWMRAQRGSSGLRALLAFDEIHGYLPPVANPPSRPVLLRLLKQARAFGLGLVLATQNPTDVAYKALSNAGTWLIGRLQTEQDKDRLLDGLQVLDTAIDRAAFDRMIAGLGQRTFLLHNVHNPPPRSFRTRWALNYLAGPLTRAQLPALKPVQPPSPAGPARPAPAPAAPASAPAAAERSFAADTTAVAFAAPAAAPARKTGPDQPLPAAAGGALPTAKTPPLLPGTTTAVYFPRVLDINRALAAAGGAFRGPLEALGIAYRPGLLIQASLRYTDRRYGLDYTRRVACLETDPTRPDWNTSARAPLDSSALPAAPEPEARFFPLPPALAAVRAISALQKDYLDWLVRTAVIVLRANPAFKIYAAPDLPEQAFLRQVDLAMREGLQSAQEKTSAGYAAKLDALQRKIERQQVVVDRRANEVGARRAEQNSTDLEFVAGLFTGKKRSLSRSVTKRRMTGQAKGELDEARKLLETLEDAWKALDAERQESLRQIQADWQARAAGITTIPVSPARSSIYVDTFAVAWLPYYIVRNPDGIIEAPGF